MYSDPVLSTVIPSSPSTASSASCRGVQSYPCRADTAPTHSPSSTYGAIQSAVVALTPKRSSWYSSVPTPPMASPSTGPSSSAPRNTGSASTVIFRLPVLIDTSPSTVTMAANIASAARRRAVHFVCIFQDSFRDSCHGGGLPWWQRKRQQHRGARGPFVAGQLPIPTHLTRCSYSVQCIA